jgi:hypothetical protein
VRYPSIDPQAIEKYSSLIEEQRDKYDNEGRIHVFDSISLITDNSQHKFQLLDVIKTVVDTELRHASNIPFGHIVSMVSAAQMDAMQAVMAMGKSRKSRVKLLGPLSRIVSAHIGESDRSDQICCARGSTNPQWCAFSLNLISSKGALPCALGYRTTNTYGQEAILKCWGLLAGSCRLILVKATVLTKYAARAGQQTPSGARSR